jgi:SAM-dependent methyltransferase
MIDDAIARKERERQFHDHAFAEHVRAPLQKYYACTEKSRRRYRQLISTYGRGKTVLEYGCGTGSAAFHLAQQHARVTGIDISPVAIEQARTTAAELGVSERATFVPMDAEQLTFPDGSFDLVCGTGVLHHLRVEQAYREIARVLKPGGNAVFSEPLGHNALLNLYRRLTPQYRTADEHPLVRSDLAMARRFFGSVSVRYYHLTSPVAAPFRRLPLFPTLLAALNALDTLLLRLPGVRYQAWMSVMVLSQPRKH